MEKLEQILIISHVVAGILSLITGLLAVFLGKKGGKLHRQVGKIFFWSMFWIFASAILIVSFVRFSPFLLVIAVFSFYMAFAGVRVLTIKKTMKAAPIDWAAAVITMGFGIAMLIMGVNYQLGSAWSSVLGYLCLFFGFFTAQTGWVNFKTFKNLEKAEKMWWWLAHMGSMVGSFIASITAFLVQNGRIFNLPNELGWVPWILPALIGVPLSAYYGNKYRRQFGMGKYAVVKAARS
ncbi:MAG: hypothetical protein HEP71_23770 [Roseivirga sp.]|nr:hypothetical protein [Roseivirga sp.]